MRRVRLCHVVALGSGISLAACPSLDGFTGGDGGSPPTGDGAPPPGPDAASDVTSTRDASDAAGPDATDATSSDVGANDAGDGASSGGEAGVVDAALCADDAAGYVLCGSVCVDPNVNDANCGGCGHSCLGAGCVHGACQPFILANTTRQPNAILVDATRVYWAEQDANNASYVLSCPLAGCGSGTALATATNSDFIPALAQSASTLYFPLMTSGALYDVPKGGGPAASLASGLGAGWSVAFDAARGDVYVATGGGLVRYSTASGTTTSVISGLTSATFVAVDANNAYVAGGAGTPVVSCPLGSTCGASPAVVMASLPSDATVLYADGVDLWVGTSGTAGSFNAAVYQCPVGGACSSFLPVDVSGLVTDAGYLYYAAFVANQILRCPLPGCLTSQLLVSDCADTMTADANYLYWGSCNFAGSPGWIAKSSKQ